MAATKTTTTTTAAPLKYSATVANSQAAYNAANLAGIKAGTVTALKVDGLNGPLTQAALAKTSSGTTNLSNQNKTGIATNANGTGTVVSTSNPIVADENNTTAKVRSLVTDNTADVTKAHNDYIQMLNDQISNLQNRLSGNESSINAGFDTQKQQLGDKQKSETGQVTSTLARIGGFLGDSASAMGAMVNLNQQHIYQLNDLEAKRQSAIQEARNAVDEKLFDLAKMKANEAKDYAKEIADSKQQFFENTMKLQDFQKGQIEDKLKNLSYLEPGQISDATKREIDSFYGTPGFTDQYIAVTNAAAKAKSEKDVMDARKATLEFLQNIPAGQKITMPDGTEFTGMGKAGDVATFLQTDSSGVGHLITYNKLTGAKSISNLGVVGKGSGSGGATTLAKTDPVVKDNAVNIFQSTLEQTKSGSYYDPDTYLKLRNQLKESKNPQLVPYIDKLFLDKNNGFFNDAAINKMRKQGVYYGDTTIPDPVDPAVIDNNGDVQSDNSN